MTEQQAPDEFRFEISLSVLNHLGRNLYRNFVTVLGEAISNSWDADANNVWIEIDRDSSTFAIKDDGNGMNANDFQNKFLKVGYSKRKEGHTLSGKGRPYIGAKGIGKLALLSSAERVSIFSKVEGGTYIGGVIDNNDLDEAIKDDKSSEEYPLEGLNFELISKLSNDHDKGTIIVFENTKERIRNRDEYLRKILALSFKFSLVAKSNNSEDEFNIYVNGIPVTIKDLKDISDATQFLWLINGYSDPYTDGLEKLDIVSLPLNGAIPIFNPEIPVKGFIASVRKPSQLKITGTEERATIDLFVNGRVRERNLLRRIPTTRIVESYIYGQLDYDELDREGIDPFTSSREGIVENDPKFEALMVYFKRKLLPAVFDDWDYFRVLLKEEGDDENPRKSKRERKAEALVIEAIEEYRTDKDSPTYDEVESWLKLIQADADFNVNAYVDCFLSENLIRRYLNKNGSKANNSQQASLKTKNDNFKDQETTFKNEASISFDIRESSDDYSYLDLKDLAFLAEGAQSGAPQATLSSHFKLYRPIRNAVGHTGRLTNDAKVQLNLSFRNIKARVKKLLSSDP